MTDTFLGEVKNDLKAIVAKVEGFVENTVEPDLEAAGKATIALVARNGGSLLLKEAIALVSSIATGKWSDLTATLLANAKAAGAVTLDAEEQLAASTALQIAQASTPAQ